jgi:hypothetical protein
MMNLWNIFFIFIMVMILLYATKNFSGTGLLITWIVGIVVILFFVYMTLRTKREGYGGPIKGVARLPISDAIRICDGYYRTCLDVYKDDASRCEGMRQRCISETYYSPVQRF